ncbi:TAT-binding protein-like protein 7, AAA ATPase [Conoideocrella luteorostrata]|uniref:TAT-binding protein-like protein 7, AAA ATPase n=1 Tax=Conoideocrella luteorostrata TaxID=1105319 RepID=A0AAJ0FUX1_9HYPO|nr:TAT-binding protein-like protein 7, AAA ATPase [Conoideocrella luteorostrata]
MVSKRKRVLEDFDPNKSDSEDENFDPSDVRAPRSSKKARPSRGSRSSGGRKRGRNYRGSDIDDDGDILSDSMAEYDSLAEDGSDDEEVPVNAAGRRTRKAAQTQHNYRESSADEDADADVVADSDAAGQEVEDSDAPSTRRLVKLKVPKTASGVVTRRATRASTADAEEFVELSNSGRHAMISRDSRSRSPEAYSRARRHSRSTKALHAAPETIDEATQESSSRAAHDVDEPDELSHEYRAAEKKEPDDENMADVEVDDNAEQGKQAHVDDEEDDATPVPAVTTAVDDDDDDDVPVTRRTRASRASVAEAAGKVEKENVEEAAATASRRLTRGRSKKSTQEPSSDFEPGDDSEDEVMSQNKADDMESPTPRGRTNKRSARNSRRGDASGDEELDFDLDELNEEARELRQSSRGRRRRARDESPIVYQESRRARARVNYYMPPLTAANIEEEELEDQAPTPARRRRGAASLGWERNLNTTFGPFGGGGGGGALLSGPWGTGAAGGVDSDSSDDEMVHRSSVAGNLGMTPTSGAPTGGLLPGAPGLNAEATPNVGKIKDRKALADADPLGVDLNVDFSKVGGLQGHIDQLKEMVQLPLLYPELFAKFHVTPPRGVLFHGPPGTGKTLLARALANSVGSGGRKISFYMRKGADALSKWVGEAEKQLRLLFEEARKTQPSIIFFDEIDGLAPVRSSKQEQIHASIVSTLLALMDGMDGRGQVIVIGATNRPDNIDPALRRPGRFDREFYFPLPDIEGRRSILNIHTQDWGLSPQFMTSLAEKTKGYGGADLRALCTEAALNSIQRTYPQIYSSTEKLIVDPDKISVHASDFMISIKKLIPSSERSATSGAKPLPKAVEPLLRSQFGDAKRLLDELLPRKKKTTALEEAMYEQYQDADHGFGREAMQQEFERSRVFRPRFLIYGCQGMGQTYIASAILHYFEGVHVQNFDLPALLADGRPMEQVIVGLFTEIRRHKPSVIYIPNIDAWYATLTNTVALITFQTMLRSIPPTDPVLVLATADCGKDELPDGLLCDLFGYSRKNRMEITRPEKENRMQYFSATLDYIKKQPAEFPDPENRKKRVLEELPLAPATVPKAPTKEEAKMLKRKDHQILNALKIQLQPIMDQINRKYKKFRQPVISQSQIDYLFAESDPNYVRPDIAEGVHRPFEIVKDKHGHDVLRDTTTGKCYYNLETTTIEERLSNGFYARPKDFLFDIKTLAKDARNIGDKERTLKANELLSNVEVDVASIETNSAHVDWEGLHRRQVQRAALVAEKERKRKAMQSILERVQSDLGGANDSDSQGPLTLGEPVPGSRTTARFELRSPLSNGHDENGKGAANSSNGVGGASKEGEDVQMSGVEGLTQATQATQASVMGPPAKSDESSSIKEHTGMTQISQKSAVTSLPPGVSPSAVINDASSTKTSDPSTHRSSNFSTQLTNGNHGAQQSGESGNDGEIPDTLVPLSQATPSDDAWMHSQAHALARGIVAPGTNLTDSSISLQSQARQSSGQSGEDALGAPASQDPQSQEPPQSGRYSGSFPSQPPSVEGAIENLLYLLTDGTSGCTIEQMEQINRELMDEIWKSRHEWNRHRVVGNLSKVFNDTIEDMEEIQGAIPLSQNRHEI